MRRTKEESRKALLEAAGRLFARDGIASVKANAPEAEVVKE
jgi:AcrR family transcriptional regulator